MARPRKPRIVKELQGTLRLHRENADAPVLPAEVPDPDLAHLSPEARVLWPDFADILAKMGVLTVADGPAMGMLVEAMADYLRAKRLLEAEGYTYETTTAAGDTMRRSHPAVAQAADADRRFVVWCNHFGLTPAARNRVSGSIIEKSKNAFEDI